MHVVVCARVLNFIAHGHVYNERRKILVCAIWCRFCLFSGAVNKGRLSCGFDSGTGLSRTTLDFFLPNPANTIKSCDVHKTNLWRMAETPRKLLSRKG